MRQRVEEHLAWVLAGFMVVTVALFWLAWVEPRLVGFIVIPLALVVGVLIFRAVLRNLRR